MKECRRVALIGLDGSGKSANINKMKADPVYREYNFIWVRWKPALLAPLYWILTQKFRNFKTNPDEIRNVDEFQKLSEEQQKMSGEYDKKNRIKGKIFKSPVMRGMWISLALLDYFFQFYAKTMVGLIKNDKIIFDRFYLDLFVDQGINFGYTPEKIDKIIKKYQWLFPKLDKIIYIRVSPEICYKRKDDIPNMDYLQKRYDVYEVLCKNTKWKTIDGECPLEKVNQNIKKEIFGIE